MATECWKPVVGYEGLYEVSDLGRVRSLDRYSPIRGGGVALHRGRILRPGTHEFGYAHVQLYRDAVAVSFLVQYLVLEAFVGPRPDGLMACHNDGAPKNNVLGNLRWDTQVSNLADRVAHGTANRGQKHGMSKLSDEQAEEIRELCRQGSMTQRAIAGKFGVSPALVTMIKKREVRAV
ncbi:NUMOD4 domain-containing protein [Paraburkholderia sp. RCC_158]|uniref:NUMOD4 domain-containing protein n=1 Tax=Paraburkholderia sp. RCC_158 TaxID=3239220 RepID=UPI0035252016